MRARELGARAELIMRGLGDRIVRSSLALAGLTVLLGSHCRGRPNGELGNLDVAYDGSEVTDGLAVGAPGRVWVDTLGYRLGTSAPETLLLADDSAGEVTFTAQKAGRVSLFAYHPNERSHPEP